MGLDQNKCLFICTYFCCFISNNSTHGGISKIRKYVYYLGMPNNKMPKIISHTFIILNTFLF